MAVLVIADHDNAALKDSTHKTVTAAKVLSGDVDVLVAGQDAKAVAEAASKIAGVRKVLLAESPELGQGLAESFQALVVPLMANYDAVLTPATSQGKNLSPRIAAKLDVAPISDIIDVVDASTFVRPIYAGNALETVQSSDAKKVITVRPTAFKAAEEGGSAAVETVAAPAPRSSSPAAAACNRARTSRNTSTPLPTSWARRWAPAGPPSTPVTCPTTTRSVRPARWWPPNSTSRSASPAPSSISPA